MIEKITKELKAAMIARESEKVTLLQALKSALKYAEIDAKEELDETQQLKVVQKELKQRKEAAELFEKGGNKESAAKELREAAMLSEFLPEMPSEEAVEAAVTEAIDETGASEMKDLGKVIPLVTKKLGGLVDGSVISKIAREKIQS